MEDTVTRPETEDVYAVRATRLPSGVGFQVVPEGRKYTGHHTASMGRPVTDTIWTAFFYWYLNLSIEEDVNIELEDYLPKFKSEVLGENNNE